LSAREALRYLFKIFSVIDVTGSDCAEAIDFPLQDYEDAVVVACGGKMDVDYIVTRDDIFLKSGKDAGDIKIIAPSDFLDAFDETNE